jgi:Cys-tRNA(Pro) deacylase
LYDYVEHGGTAEAAHQLGFDEHRVVKTLVFENEKKEPLIVLMHGDRHVSTKQLARLRHVKSYAPCEPKTLTKHTGYIAGGTSPLGTKIPIPVIMQQTILDLDCIYLNGGKRGFLVGVDPRVIKQVLNAETADVAAAETED